MANVSSPDPGFDVVVVGAGAVGLAIAAALARRGRSVLVLEREPGIARGITSRNSEVIHAGLYYPTESLKARLCCAGREALYAYCEHRTVGHRKLGKLIVATREEEEATLAGIAEQGRRNGVPGLELIDAVAVSRLEPRVSARAALLSPETGIIDAHGFCLALLAEAEASDAMLLTERELVGLTALDFGWRIAVRAPDGEVETVDAGVVVDAAGLEADRIAALAGHDVEALGWRQHPCKGDYFALAPGHRVEIGRLVYPVPQGAGLGIHATLDLAGRVRFGPDAEYVDEVDYEVDAGKAATFRAAASRYLPELAGMELVPDYAGIRPKRAGPGEPFRDFVVEETSARGVPGFVACLGIESPGLTAALAIGEHVAGLL